MAPYIPPGIFNKPTAPSPAPPAGVMAQTLGYPVDLMNILLGGLKPAFPEPIGGSTSFQRGFNAVDKGIADFLAPDEDNLAVVEDAKGAVRSLGDIAGGKVTALDQYLGKTNRDIGRSFEETSGERQDRIEQERTDKLKQQEDAFAAQSAGLGDEKQKFLESLALGAKGAGMVDLGPVAENSGELDKILQGFVQARAEEKAADANTISLFGKPIDKSKLAILAGLGGGVLDARKSGLGYGDQILSGGVNAVGSKGQEEERKRQERRQDLSDDLQLYKIKLEAEQKNAPKFHSTKTGLFVEKTIEGPDGKPHRVLQPFTGATFGKLDAVTKVLTGLGAPKVDILTLSKTINPGDPGATEQALIAAAQQAGALPVIFGDIMNSKQWNEIANETMSQHIGENAEAVQKLVANQRLALLVATLQASPARQKALFELLNKARGTE